MCATTTTYMLTDRLMHSEYSIMTHSKKGSVWKFICVNIIHISRSHSYSFYYFILNSYVLYEEFKYCAKIKTL